jgi:SAM-dependent methyltransferase
MIQYEDRTYGERIAGVYDDFYGGYDEAMIDRLAELAGRGPGRALELGIGTGRVALPLRQRGVEVAGIDASPAMIARLRAKAGGAEVQVVEASFADFDLGQAFDLVYVVFNTFYSLLTQEEQVRCFRSVARHLAGEGVFVLEVFVPDLCRFEEGQTVRAVNVETDRLQIDITMHDAVKQQVRSQHLLIAEEGLRLYPVVLRYTWPSELDLMARLAGLELRQRWSSWEKGAFGPRSTRHISVYGRAAD